MIVHESRRFDLRDVTQVDGIPVTTPELTLLDLAAVCGSSTVEMALDRAEAWDLLHLDTARLVVERRGGRGRRGSAVLRALLEARDPSRVPTASEMETMLLQVLRANGYPDPVTQFQIPGTPFRADAAYPQWRIAIEYDSYQEHAGRRALTRDQRRRLLVQAAGFEQLSVSKPELAAGGATLCAAIRALARPAS